MSGINRVTELKSNVFQKSHDHSNNSIPTKSAFVGLYRTSRTSDFRESSLQVLATQRRAVQDGCLAVREYSLSERNRSRELSAFQAITSWSILNG